MKNAILFFASICVGLVSCNNGQTEQPKLAYMHNGKIHTVTDEQITKYFKKLEDGPSSFSKFEIVEEEGSFTLRSGFLTNGKQLTQVSLLLEKSEDGKYLLISGNSCKCVTDCEDGTKQIVIHKEDACGCIKCDENALARKTNTGMDSEALHNILKI